MPEKKYFILKFSYVFALWLCAQFLSAQPTLDWAKQFTGTSGGQGRCIKTDNAGNVFTAGYFWGLTDFDPGPGIDTLRAIVLDGFITKFNSAGDFIWAKQIKGKGHESIESIVLDDSSNIYIVGEFGGTTDFDPGIGIDTLTPIAYNAMFILKLDSAGSFRWVKEFDDAHAQTSGALTLDINGNIYVTGFFIYSADFDPGAGTYSLTITPGNMNGYILKLNNAGNFIWVKQLTGTSVHTSAITVDQFENVYTTGSFGGPTDFDPGPLSYTLASQGTFEIFVHKLDKNGNFLWIKQPPPHPAFGYGASIILDRYKNVYIGGYDRSLGKSFIGKFDSLGNAIWTHTINPGFVNSLAIDGSDNIIGVGKFWGSSDFNPGAGVDSIISSGDYDAFIVKLNPKGKYICGAGIGGQQEDVATSVAIDNFQNICITGFFRATADFDPGPGTFNLVSSAGQNVFVAKYSSCQLITENNEMEIVRSSSFSAFPNPTNDMLQLDFSRKVAVKEIQMYDALGQRVQCKLNFETLTIDIQSLPPGNYLLRIETDNNFYSKIIVKE